MKRIVFAGVLFIILSIIAGILWYSDFFRRNTNIPLIQELSPTNNSEDLPLITTITDGLEVPWDIEFLPDGSLLVTERAGRIVKVNPQTGDKNTILTLSSVKQIGEGGLHGITLHPDFENNNYVYVYYTYEGNGTNTVNKVSRFTYSDSSLSNEVVLLDEIPGASNHDGGALSFGPDNLLYVATGDAQEPSFAQNQNSLAGKILRLKDDGTAAADNPFNNRTYSYGHRNSQGICWNSQGQLYSTEHGPSGAGSGYDELNLIQAGKNYGWPTIQGDQTQNGMQSPLLQSGNSDTWAPASAACINDSVFFGGLRGNALYEAVIKGDGVELKTHLKGELGRIRAVTIGPDSMIYISTSNRDGRGVPRGSDDKILRINPSKL
jgi:glucose/arabinose dehydrogenase